MDSARHQHGKGVCSEHPCFCWSCLYQCGRIQCLPTGFIPGQGHGTWWGALKTHGRIKELDVGGFDDFFLPDPVSTWYQSFYDDYRTYIKVAERDAVLAAQIASPGTHVTIMFVATVLEEAEYAAQSNNLTLQIALRAGLLLTWLSSSPMRRTISG